MIKKIWMVSVDARKYQQICKICTEKHVVQCFILIAYNHHVQQQQLAQLQCFYKSAWINSHIYRYILSGSLSKNFE